MAPRRGATKRPVSVTAGIGLRMRCFQAAHRVVHGNVELLCTMEFSSCSLQCKVGTSSCPLQCMFRASSCPCCIRWKFQAALCSVRWKLQATHYRVCWELQAAHEALTTHTRQMSRTSGYEFPKFADGSEPYCTCHILSFREVVGKCGESLDTLIILIHC